MEIKVTIDLGDEEDEYIDPSHEMGLSSDGYERLVESLMWLGSVQDVEKA